MRFLSLILVLAAFSSLVSADVYLHYFRGSNNRLNEQTATRTNNNRLFDSQNNARGGYNVGDKTAKAAPTDNNPTDPLTIYDYTKTADGDAAQYPFMYFEGSVVPIEWTNQHGCGGSEKSDPHQQNCEIIMQYMCETTAYTSGVKYVEVPNIHDGTTTDTPQEIQKIGDAAPADNNARRGRHESEQYYLECKSRSRNKGLFTADQNLNGRDAAINTRQNPNGGRSGLECPEERDYYPYWSPSPWKDIAIITDHAEERCGTYQSLSQNTATVYKCEKNGAGTTKDTYIKAITQADCTAAVGVWTAYSNKVGKAPECIPGANYWSRANHLGNGRGGEALRYYWKLPTIADLKTHNVAVDANGFAKCVFRLRYNISTDDYDGWNINATLNNNPGKGVRSPVTQNPTVDVGGPTGLKLAVNTAQFGRTFQDRSHIFYIKQRPAAIANKNILNLSVRGKRGNIVQTFPAVEYDFIPNKLNVYQDELVHVQWTGSNTHNNGGGGGDGQAGDAGEGTGGTDRQNMAQLLNANENYPMPLDKFPDNMWSNMQCTQIQQGITLQPVNSWVDCALTMTTSGYIRSTSAMKNDFNSLLNNAPPSLVGGVLFDFKNVDQDTTYDYMCTRNNNFSNRSQKGAITVKKGTRPQGA